MISFDWTPRTRVVFGEGSFEQLGEHARALGFRRSLLVADAGMVAAGIAQRAVRLLERAGVVALPFHGFGENPDSAMAECGRRFAEDLNVDSVIGVGGGSSLDCAKAINFLLTNGGAMRDYRGYGRAARPLLPMISATTTAGTGSEAQSYAVVSEAETHVKMACGDPSAAVRIAILDPRLLVTAPRHVRANSGFDALTHAVETLVTTRRTPFSELFSREAWRRLSANYERVLEAPGDLEAQAGMQIGAHLAGAAIEASMLGATHACANPLTARFGVTHGIALAVLLPHVVRWNESVAGALYRSLEPDLTARLEGLARAGGFPSKLRELGVPEAALPQLAADAAQQWTGQFNPRPFDAAGALEIYRCAF